MLPRNKKPYYGVELRETTSQWWTSGSAGFLGTVQAAGTWGFAATAPADIKLACLQIAMQAYRRRFGGENTTSTAISTAAGVIITPEDIPAGARALLRTYKRRL